MALQYVLSDTHSLRDQQSFQNGFQATCNISPFGFLLAFKKSSPAITSTSPRSKKKKSTWCDIVLQAEV